MSFLGSLTKGFIRSAVNQVGRDGGKIISNKIYSDNSSISISEVEHGTNTSAIKIERSDLIKAGYKAEILESGIFMNIFALIGSIIIPIFGPLYWFFIAIRNLFKKRIKFYTISQQPLHVRDRRYTTGKRQEGYKNVKVYSNAVIIPTASERGIFIAKGIVALIFAISIGCIQYSLIAGILDVGKETAINSKNNKQVDIGVITAPNGLRLRQEPTESSKTLLTIPKNDTIKIIKLDGPKHTIGSITANWYQVEYKNQIGWGWSGLIEKR